MESTAIFAELLPRLEHLGLARSPNGVASTFVSGLRSLPARYRLSAWLKVGHRSAPGGGA
jgi:hypothetical protein